MKSESELMPEDSLQGLNSWEKEIPFQDPWMLPAPSTAGWGYGPPGGWVWLENRKSWMIVSVALTLTHGLPFENVSINSAFPHFPPWCDPKATRRTWDSVILNRTDGVSIFSSESQANIYVSWNHKITWSYEPTRNPPRHGTRQEVNECQFSLLKVTEATSVTHQNPWMLVRKQKSNGGYWKYLTLLCIWIFLVKAVQDS